MLLPLSKRLQSCRTSILSTSILPWICVVMHFPSFAHSWNFFTSNTSLQSSPQFCVWNLRGGFGTMDMSGPLSFRACWPIKRDTLCEIYDRTQCSTYFQFWRLQGRWSTHSYCTSSRKWQADPTPPYSPSPWTDGTRFPLLPTNGSQNSVSLHPLEHPWAIRQSTSDASHFIGAHRARHFGSKSPELESNLRYSEFLKSLASVISAFPPDIEAKSCHTPIRAITTPLNFFNRSWLWHIGKCIPSPPETFHKVNCGLLLYILVCMTTKIKEAC